ncbi:MAG: aminotransferase class III-fold pyridoxal phosphate-dependent enzyme [Rhodospirillales bacterium]|nr:aminotransferase class III-fold pyridoxal phosphate-dependent enzyme [Rhodospirillales bacterium]
MALNAARISETTELEQAQAALASKTLLSQEMALDRTEVINGAMAASGVCPPPIFITRNEGAYFEDIDGNSYLDTCMGFGVHLLGHRPAAVEAAIRDQLGRGWHFSLRGEAQLAYARLIQSASESNERVVFCNTGTEATMYAIRAARALTGKTNIALFDISYHGAHDSVLVWETPGSAPGAPVPTTLGHGIPHGVLNDVTLLPYKHPAALQRIRDNADTLAAVMVEPVQGSRPDGEVEGFLTELRKLCDELGIILIFDEVLTGFRLAYGGAQERFGIEADITTYGKAVAGGLPIGIVAGRKELMESFGDFTSPGGIFFGGTFSGNPLSIASGLGTLRYLRAHPETYTHKGNSWRPVPVQRKHPIPEISPFRASKCPIKIQKGRSQELERSTLEAHVQQMTGDQTTAPVLLRSFGLCCQPSCHARATKHTVATLLCHRTDRFSEGPNRNLAIGSHHLNQNRRGQREKMSRKRLDHGETSRIATIAVAIAGAIAVAVTVGVAVEAAAVAVVVVAPILRTTDLVGGQIV